MKVGIPRALFYYSFYPMFKTFFEKLGVKTVVSSPTTKKVLDEGIKDTVTDACVPIKLYHGHVADLIGKVDFIFVPRLVCIDNEATFCPKFLGLPDMVTYSIDNLPPLITPRIDFRNGRLELLRACYSVGKMFTKNVVKIFKAYRESIKSLKNYEQEFLKGEIPPLNIKKRLNSDINLGVLGYPYMLYDQYLSLNLLNKLFDLGVSVTTPEMVSREDKLKHAAELKKTLFWHYSNGVIRTAFHMFKNCNIDGIIHVTAFGCGPDFIVDKLLELEAKKRSVPFLTITLDEQTGEEGLKTRLEAFVDMLRLRRRLA